jgi:hypothetical protein
VHGDERTEAHERHTGGFAESERGRGFDCRQEERVVAVVGGLRLGDATQQLVNGAPFAAQLAHIIAVTSEKL